jgi:hypothetical protein
MPPVIMWMLGAVGAAVLVRWLAKESRRINGEIDAVRAASVAEAAGERASLERDPDTGVYRPK